MRRFLPRASLRRGGHLGDGWAPWVCWMTRGLSLSAFGTSDTLPVPLTPSTPGSQARPCLLWPTPGHLSKANCRQLDRNFLSRHPSLLWRSLSRRSCVVISQPAWEVVASLLKHLLVFLFFLPHLASLLPHFCWLGIVVPNKASTPKLAADSTPSGAEGASRICSVLISHLAIL